MDPKACLTELTDALHCGDYETANEHASNLLDWLRKDGFVPVASRVEMKALLSFITMHWRKT